MTTGARRAGRWSTAQQVPRRERSRSHLPRSLHQPHTRKTGKRAGGSNAAVLQERARVARDLHDSVSQTLYAITLAASRARRLLEQNHGTEAQHIIDDVAQLANAGQSELRALLTNVFSDRLTAGGLTTTLVHLAADHRTRNGLDIRLSLAAEPDLPAKTKQALALISREALNNVVKHAGAHRVDLVLTVAAAEIVLIIADDGRGFDPAVVRPGHFGMQSIRERAAAVGGTLEFLSEHGVGTRVRVRISRVGRT